MLSPPSRASLFMDTKAVNAEYTDPFTRETDQPLSCSPPPVVSNAPVVQATLELENSTKSPTIDTVPVKRTAVDTSKAKTHATIRTNKATFPSTLKSPKECPKETVATYIGMTPKEMLTAFYKQHKPSNIGKVDYILNKYRFQEDILFRLVATKYGQNPAIFGISTEVPPVVWPTVLPKTVDDDNNKEEDSLENKSITTIDIVERSRVVSMEVNDDVADEDGYALDDSYATIPTSNVTVKQSAVPFSTIYSDSAMARLNGNGSTTIPSPVKVSFGVQSDSDATTAQTNHIFTTKQLEHAKTDPRQMLITLCAVQEKIAEGRWENKMGRLINVRQDLLQSLSTDSSASLPSTPSSPFNSISQESPASSIPGDCVYASSNLTCVDGKNIHMLNAK